MPANKKLAAKEVVEKFKKIHGPTKYDYSKIDYIGAKKKITIICKKHGAFKQRPDVHKKGSGCPCCSVNKRTKNKFDAIKKSNIIHNGAYDYSLFEYRGALTKAKIICPKHGVFMQTPNNHTNNKQGCPSCFGNVNMTYQHFVDKANRIHNHKYQYPLWDENIKINSQTKIEIICPKHGLFKQTISNHTHINKYGCSRCVNKISKNQYKLFKQIKYKYPDSILEYEINVCSKKYFVDIFIPAKNIIVEYYGDYWHCNPKIYKKDFYHQHKKMLAKQIWKHDFKRKQVLKNMGYELVVIWENDYKKQNDINKYINL